LESKSFAKLTYVWISPARGRYNVTAYVHQVPEETSVENNRITKFVRVSGPLEVGVKAGDWIKYDYTIANWPAGTPYPEWLKVEILTVEETTATIRVTMHMSDGTEQNQTMTMDIVAGGQVLGLSGLVIPANSEVGDRIYISGYGKVAIADETTRIYAGANRTVVYTSFFLHGAQLTYYWDKQTGVMMEASAIYPQLNMTATAKATQTNMWQALTIIYLAPSEISVAVGDVFTVNVTVTNVTDLYAWQIKLFFDPTILNCTNAWYPDGHVFAGKEIVSLEPVIDNIEGFVLYGCCLLGEEENFNGNGTLCQIQFRGISRGNSSLEFAGPEETYLLNFDLNEIPNVTYDGYVMVEGRLYCDLNSDGVVDIRDMAIFGLAFGSYPGHTRWNPAADIDGNGIINILDGVKIAKNFGKKW